MMRFRFDNGLVLGGEEFQIQAPIEGLETPEIRNGDGLYSGADGGYIVSQYYGHRTITIHGFFIGRCPETTTQLRQKLLRNLFMRYYSGIVIEDFANQYWFTQGYVSDIKCEVTSPKVGEYQISIICPDPTIYKANSWYAEGPESIVVNLNVNGETAILRQGDMEAFPVYEFKGVFTAPWGIQIDGNEFMLDYNSTSEETITIDMKTRQVYDQDGNSLAQYRTVNSYWLGLQAGVNNVKIVSGSNSGTAKLTYSAGYRGV